MLSLESWQCPHRGTCTPQAWYCQLHSRAGSWYMAGAQGIASSLQALYYSVPSTAGVLRGGLCSSLCNHNTATQLVGPQFPSQLP